VGSISAIVAPAEVGVGQTVQVTATVAAGVPAGARLLWTIAPAVTGVRIAPRTGRDANVSVAGTALASIGSTFRVQCEIAGSPLTATTSPALVAVAGVQTATLTHAPALANQLGQAFPAGDTAEPNRDGVAGNAVTVAVTPAGRPFTVTLRPPLDATVAGAVITPGSQTGRVQVRVQDDATAHFLDIALRINSVPLQVSAFTAQGPPGAGFYGRLNTIHWALSDAVTPFSAHNRIIGELITQGAPWTIPGAFIPNGGFNPAPRNDLSAPANDWNDQVFSVVGPATGPAGDANLRNVNRYVGPGVPLGLPIISTLNQGFAWRAWSSAWSTRVGDVGRHVRTLFGGPTSFFFRTEHVFAGARARIGIDPYAGPPLIVLSNLRITPAVPAAQFLAADGVATAQVQVRAAGAGSTAGTSIAGRAVAVAASPSFDAPGGPFPVVGTNAAGQIRAGIAPGDVPIQLNDSVFANRQLRGTVRLAPVQLTGIRAPAVVRGPTALTAVVTLQALPGGRELNFAVDAAAQAAGVVVAPRGVAAGAGTIRSATVTRPAGFVGTVTVTAADRVVAAASATVTIRFQ
jgi:hypothetical protein